MNIATTKQTSSCTIWALTISNFSTWFRPVTDQIVRQTNLSMYRVLISTRTMKFQTVSDKKLQVWSVKESQNHFWQVSYCWATPDNKTRPRSADQATWRQQNNSSKKVPTCALYSLWRQQSSLSTPKLGNKSVVNQMKIADQFNRDLHL